MESKPDSPHSPGTKGVSRVSKIIRASRKEIYQAFTDPKLVVQWLAPDNMRCEVHSYNAREGGSFEMTLTYLDLSQGARGKTSENKDSFKGRFTKLIPYKIIEEIIEFDSPAKAIRYLEENRHNALQLPEAIFLDISMPGMSGFQFLDQLYFLRLCVRQISVIMLTSSLNTDDYQRAVNHALVKKFVNKPLDSAIIEDIKAMFFNVYFNNDESTFLQQDIIN